MSDKGAAPALRPAQGTLGTVRVSPVNAIIAVGDTLSLTLTGRTLSGASVTHFDSVEYVLENSADSLRIRISPTGVVTAVNPSSPNNSILVQVMGFHDGVVRADQAVIQVTAATVPGATLSIHPVGADSTRLAIGSNKRITPVIKNLATGQSVPGPQIRFEYGLGDSTVMQCYNPIFVSTATVTGGQLWSSACGAAFGSLNTIHANEVGSAWVIASVLAYGVPLRDSVQYTLTNGFRGAVAIEPTSLSTTGGVSINPTIAPGGTITFINNFSSGFGATVQWIFENPAAATVANPASTLGDSVGNVTALNGRELATRRFLTPGVYAWTATVSGGVPPFTGATVKGTVTVR